MIIVIKKTASKQEAKQVKDYILKCGLRIFESEGEEKTVIGAIGDERVLDKEHLEMLPGVEKVIPILAPYKMASREYSKENTTVKVNGVSIGGEEVVLMAGPCAIESEKQLLDTAVAVKKAGAKVLRGSAFKPRTSPYEFQGMQEEGLKLLRKAKEKTGLVTMTEVMDPRDVELVAEYVDILQIGARNMQNYELLKECGNAGKPILLKNGLSATIKEFLMAAEYILAHGNEDVILCERGIRTFETETRFTLDLSAIPVVKKLSHLPIIVDPSHSSGKSYLVAPMAKAAVAVGADGLVIEVHPNPACAQCDGPQQLTPPEYAKLVEELRPIAKAVGRKIA